MWWEFLVCYDDDDAKDKSISKERWSNLSGENFILPSSFSMCLRKRTQKSQSKKYTHIKKNEKDLQKVGIEGIVKWMKRDRNIKKIERERTTEKKKKFFKIYT